MPGEVALKELLNCARGWDSSGGSSGPFPGPRMVFGVLPEHLSEPNPQMPHGLLIGPVW